MNKNRGRKNHSGMTLVEAVIALFICSLLFLLLLTVYGSFVKMSSFQKSSAELENQFMVSGRVIEKDLRLAGFGIPGNGLYPHNGGTPGFFLDILSNEDNAQTVLSQDAHIGDSNIKVKNAAGILANQWVCLGRGSTIAFYTIARIGLRSGSDTVVLKDSTIHTLWGKDSAQVYFAKGVHYALEIRNGKTHLVRTSLINTCPIGTTIDTFAVYPKGIGGADCGGDYSQAKILNITLGGHVGPAGKTIALTKSFDIDLRNSQ